MIKKQTQVFVEKANIWAMIETRSLLKLKGPAIYLEGEVQEMIVHIQFPQEAADYVLIYLGDLQERREHLSVEWVTRSRSSGSEELSMMCIAWEISLLNNSIFHVIAFSFYQVSSIIFCIFYSKSCVDPWLTYSLSLQVHNIFSFYFVCFWSSFLLPVWVD